jgi:hypothetical protein
MKTATQHEMIERLVNETHRPRDEVEQAFMDTWRDLSDGARVHDYLPLFVAKRVAQTLRSRERH